MNRASDQAFAECGAKRRRRVARRRMLDEAAYLYTCPPQHLGASRRDVRKIFRFFYPLSPLSTFGSDLYYKIHATSLTPLPLRCGHHTWELPKDPSSPLSIKGLHRSPPIPGNLSCSRHVTREGVTHSAHACSPYPAELKVFHARWRH